MARKTTIGADSNITQFGTGTRVERGLPTAPDQPPRFYVYTKTDVSADPDTTESERWDEVGIFDTEDEAMAKANALAGE